MPAMGLVYGSREMMFSILSKFQCCYACNGFSIYSKKNHRRLSKRFQCCYACNGFSIQPFYHLNMILESFNAAMPAMGLVFIRLKVLKKVLYVSMLLCLQWVQYICVFTELINIAYVSMLLCLQWVQYKPPIKALPKTERVSMLLCLQWVQYKTKLLCFQQHF